jgi:hypothetical protein
MSDERPFTLRQIDQARGDLYALQDDLDFIRVQPRAATNAERGLARRDVGHARRGGRSGHSSGSNTRRSSAVRQQRDRFAASVLLIEDKAAGTQLIQELIADGCHPRPCSIRGETHL